MIKQTLNERQHAALSVAILIVGLLLIYAALIMPGLTKRSNFNEQLEDLQFQYSRFNHLEKQRDQIIDELQQLRQEQTDATGFLENKPQALAAADLQNYIKNIIESNSGNLISTQVVRHETSETFPDIRIKIHMRADIDALQEVFYDLEANQPTLLIDNLYLQKRNRRVSRRASQRARVEQAAALIEARFEVTGYIYQTELLSES